MTESKTSDGRERSKYNSQKGGLHVYTIMACTEVCMYRSICPVYDLLVSGYQRKTFSCSCALEVAAYLNLKEYYFKSPQFEHVDKELLEELIMLSIRIDRLRRYISINPDLTTPNGQLSQSYILLGRLQGKLIAITKKVMIL